MSTVPSRSTSADSPASAVTPSLPDRFDALCAASPPPPLLPAQLPGVSDEQLSYLRQNPSGEILVDSKAVWDNSELTRPVITSAIRNALDHAAGISTVHLLTNSDPHGPTSPTPSTEDPNPPTSLHTPEDAKLSPHSVPTAESLVADATKPFAISPAESAITSDPTSAAHPLETYDVDSPSDTAATKASDATSDHSLDLNPNTLLADLSLSDEPSDAHSSAPNPSYISPSASSDTSSLPQTSLLELLGKPRFTPDPRLSNFTWGSSHAKRVLDAFNTETERVERARAAGSPPTRKRPSAPTTPGRAPPVDAVQLGAQEEAAASVVLRDVRAANARLRRTTYRPAETPVWAIVAQRGGKLKPEAAAEMARARVAAAAAAAVMREADEDDEHDVSVRHNGNDRSNGPGPIPISELSDEAFPRDGRHEFFREYVSPRSRTFSSDGPLFPLHGGQLPEALSLEGAGRGKIADKKRVMFAEDTVFGSK